MERTQAAGFHEVWEAHARDVHRFALYLSGDRDAADDLTSEAFLRVWTAWDRVLLPTVRSYLLATVRNLFLQGRRIAERERPLPDELPLRRPLVSEMEEKEELERVQKAIVRLSPLDRAALLLRAEEGLSYEAIASALAIPAVAARVRVHRARVRLAEELKRSPACKE